MDPRTENAATIPQVLITQFAKGNGSVFVGAGISMGAGLPSWKELIQPLIDQWAKEVGNTMNEESWAAVLRSPLPDLAQYYDTCFGRRARLAIPGFRSKYSS